MASPPAASPADYLVEGIAPARVIAPAGIEDLASALRATHSAGESAVPWGGGTRMHVGGLPRRYDVALDLRGLDHIVEYEPADLTVIVEAGVRLSALQSRLALNGQRLPFDPPFPERATVGGSLASNAVGPMRSGFGGVRDLVIGMKVVHADGTVTRSGGKVVKNVSGYDLMRPHIGAFGTLGVIAEAAFKLVPRPAATRTYVATFGSIASARTACEALLRAPFQPERSVVWSGGRAAAALGRLRGGAALAPATVCVLVLTLAAGHSAVERMVAETRKTMAGAGEAWHDVVPEAEADALWTTMEPGPSESPIVTVRATLKPLAGFEVLDAAMKMRGGPGGSPEQGLDPDAVYHVGFGTLLAHWTSRVPLRPPRSPDVHAAHVQAASAVIQGIRAAATSRGVAAVIERCPTELKSSVDIWGESGPAVEIMRNMKLQFDPAGTLNPGRFVGGL